MVYFESTPNAEGFEIIILSY